MNGEVNVYDDSIPVGERLGTQSLYGDPEPGEEPQSTTMRELVTNAKGWPPKLKAHPKPKAPSSPPEPPRARRIASREVASTALEVAGLAVFSLGFGLLHLWLGVVVAGLCLVLLGVATAFPPTRRQD